MPDSLRSALHPLGSEVGDKRSLLLAESRAIAPKYSDRGPKYRTRWEDLLEFGGIGPSLFAKAMRRAEGGALPASEIEGSGEGSYVLSFCLAQAQAMAERFVDYVPEWGFDADLFIIIGDMFDFRMIEVYCEVFPRSADGRMVMDYASAVSHRVPLLIADEERGGPGVIVTPVLGLLQGDGGERGESARNLSMRVSHWWQETRGIWPVTGDFLINYFLNRTIASIALFEGEEVLAASVRKDFDGEHSDASVRKLRLI